MVLKISSKIKLRFHFEGDPCAKVSKIADDTLNKDNPDVSWLAEAVCSTSLSGKHSMPQTSSGFADSGSVITDTQSQSVMMLQAADS